MCVCVVSIKVKLIKYNIFLWFFQIPLVVYIFPPTPLSLSELSSLPPTSSDPHPSFPPHSTCVLLDPSPELFLSYTAMTLSNPPGFCSSFGLHTKV